MIAFFTNPLFAGLNVLILFLLVNVRGIWLGYLIQAGNIKMLVRVVGMIVAVGVLFWH